MNKEFNDNNYQSHSHGEGQQNNIAHDRTGKGVNEPPEVKRTTRQEGEEGRAETESDRANKNEDKDIRGGNSSI